MKEVRRRFVFHEPLSSSSVYDTLRKVVDETLSDGFTFRYECLVHYERQGKEFRASEADGTGSIRKGKLTLMISAGSAYVEGRTTQNYFEGIELSEPTSWKGGSPGPRDREELAKYADDVMRALVRTETGKPEGWNEEKIKPMCSE